MESILTWNKCIWVEKQDFLHERISDKRVSGGVPPSGKTISHCRIQSHAFGKKAHVWLNHICQKSRTMLPTSKRLVEKRASTHIRKPSATAVVTRKRALFIQRPRVGQEALQPSCSLKWWDKKGSLGSPRFHTPSGHHSFTSSRHYRFGLARLHSCSLSRLQSLGSSRLHSFSLSIFHSFVSSRLQSLGSSRIHICSLSRPRLHSLGSSRFQSFFSVFI